MYGKNILIPKDVSIGFRAYYLGLRSEFEKTIARTVISPELND